MPVGLPTSNRLKVSFSHCVQYGTPFDVFPMFKCEFLIQRSYLKGNLMRPFNPKLFLSTPGAGREMMSFRKGQVIFAQGDASDAVFVIQTGRVRLRASTQGRKEATLDI